MGHISQNKNECCGCGACVYICPKSAITLIKDEFGFFYARIDESKCILCGKCTKICGLSLNHNTKFHDAPDAYYACSLKDKEQLNTSQSGGAFYSIASYFINNNAIVYGVALCDDYCSVRHIRVDTIDDLYKVKGSKYAQSDVSIVLPEIENDLKAGKNILFSGTPCQCYQVKTLFSVFQKQITLCEIICHGVVSNDVWKYYLEFMKNKYGGNIEYAAFRGKHNGWTVHKETITINKVDRSERIYTDFFYSHLGMRPVCFSCKFTSVKRCADFTIGDFWGIETLDEKFAKENAGGISVTMFNSEYAKACADEILKSMTYCSFEKYPLQFQSPLCSPIVKPKRYNNYIKSVKKIGLEHTINRYCIFHKIDVFIIKVKWKLSHIRYFT